MPKNDGAQSLQKRLQKIENANGRLGDIATRIRTQADTIAELVALARTLTDGSATPAAAPRTRRTAAKRTATAKRASPATQSVPAPAARTTKARSTPARAATARRARRPVIPATASTPS